MFGWAKKMVARFTKTATQSLANNEMDLADCDRMWVTKENLDIGKSLLERLEASPTVTEEQLAVSIGRDIQYVRRRINLARAARRVKVIPIERGALLTRATDLYLASEAGRATAAGDTNAGMRFKRRSGHDIEALESFMCGHAQELAGQLRANTQVVLTPVEMIDDLKFVSGILEDAGFKENADFILAYSKNLGTAERNLNQRLKS